MGQPILGDRQSHRKEGRGSQLKAVGSDGGRMNVWGTEIKLQYPSFSSRTGGGGREEDGVHIWQAGVCVRGVISEGDTHVPH